MSDINHGIHQHRVRLEERVRIDDLPACAQVLDMWYPLVGDDAHQQLLDLRLDLHQPLDMGHDQEHGNPMAHVRLLRPAVPALEFHASYLVARFDGAGQPAPDAAATCAARPLLLRDLEVGLPEAESAGLAREAAALAPSCRDPLARAARLGQAAADRGPAAVVERFVHLCRLAGIPARVVAGVRATVTVGEHLWAEVFVADRGWIAADPICGAAGGDLWALGLDHVSRTRGQDLLLQPVQHGPRLAALSGPYAEVDGRPHPVSTAISASVEGPAGAATQPTPGARLPDLAALLPPAAGAHLGDRREHAHHRVVHPDVDAAPFARHAVGGSIDGLAVRHVERYGERLAAGEADLAGGVREGLLAAGEQGDTVAARAEGTRDLPSDAAGGAGHHDGPARGSRHRKSTPPGVLAPRL